MLGIHCCKKSTGKDPYELCQILNLLFACINDIMSIQRQIQTDMFRFFILVGLHILAVR